jgi:hypothetical protein
MEVGIGRRDMRKALLAVMAGALVMAASACSRGTEHVTNTSAGTSAPAATVSSGTDTSAIQSDLTGVDHDLANVDGQLNQTNGDLASTNEGDVQQ